MYAKAMMAMTVRPRTPIAMNEAHLRDEPFLRGCVDEALLRRDRIDATSLSGSSLSPSYRGVSVVLESSGVVSPELLSSDLPLAAVAVDSSGDVSPLAIVCLNRKREASRGQRMVAQTL